MKNKATHLASMLLAGSLIFPAMAQTSTDKLADLSKVPQLTETKQQRYARMQ